MKRVARLALCWALLAATVVVAQSSPATTTFRYDANGNLLGKSQDGVEWTYVYDVRDRLVEVRRDGQVLESYRYDYQGRRISRTDASGTTTEFLWDGDHLVAEQNTSGATVARYTYAGDRPIAFEDTATGRGAYLLDALGSPVSLSRSDGTLAVRYHYDAWGATEELAGESESSIGFTGHLFDRAPGLYYAKARYYDPQIGRFLGVDPFEGTADEPRSLHPYLYAYANPNAYLDRDGRCVTSWLKQSGFCQSIERFLERQYAGDPLAVADRAVAVHQLVMDARRQFRENFGREALPDQVVAMVGSTQLTAGFEEIDTSGRAEPANLEWSIATAGVGARLAYSAARAGGATTTARFTASARQAADEAVGELFGASPSDVVGLARQGRQLWTGSGPGQAGPTGIIGEAADGGLQVEARSTGLGSVAPTTASDHAATVRWVDEGGNLRAGRGPGMSARAYEYQSGTTGARSNSITGRGQAPALDYTTVDGRVASVKFDGVEGGQLIDRKIAVHTGAKTRALARRQSEALQQHKLSGVWELPNAAEAARAKQLLADEGITNIVVRITPP